MKKVLIIEKQLSSRELLLNLLKGKEFQLFTVEDGMSALTLLQKHSFDLILSDLKGVKALDRSNRRPLGTPIVHLSDDNDPSLKDVDHVLRKPLSEKGVYQLLIHLLDEGRSGKKVIAESPQMKRMLREVEKIAKSHSNVFISGESGTGKEVIAGLIHAHSRRKGHPFIRVNCAALADTLIESEFFGHEKGAFTGAHQKRIGRFERADKGTLLLDEVSEIPLALQTKLLRVVQEQELERVGGMEAIHVDVRLVSTSNREMKEAIHEKTFRADLYYRLNVVPIYLPPLRERKEDILPLANHFLVEVCRRDQVPLKTFSEKAEEKLLSYSWSGNIRELRNVIEHGVVMDYSNIIEEEHLLIDLRRSDEALPIVTVKELEKKHILRMLDHFDGNRTQSAKALGISIRTLRNKLNEYNT
ncbi:MAG: sigma-54 dependent transcriptional regulator [Candidatus Neptunochlamydia sp.]|nr:sigma-54 dependent transcriptional regulator [Candidatus Neptunochlamydia sp.]